MPIASGRLNTHTFASLCSGVVLLAAIGGSCGCAIPIGAEKVSPRQSFREETRTALGSPELSNETREVLGRFGLQRQYTRAPEETLLALHQRALSDDRRDLLSALAELNYAQAEQSARSPRPWVPRQARDYYLSAAIYAHLYLVSASREKPPSPFDPRFRMACEVYNRGLAEGLSPAGETNPVVALEAGARTLPVGPISLEVQPSPDLQVRPDEIEQLLAADRFRVRGLTVRNREPGLGAPLIAITPNTDVPDLERRIPLTLFLRVHGDTKEWSEGRRQGGLALHSGFDGPTVEVDGRTVPLQTDTTAPLAHLLTDRFVWRVGRMQFFSSQQRVPNGIHPVLPYQPGRIPVVFVHGTFSSPVWWAEMWNTLAADPVLARRCQFWNYVYNTGNPLTLSAAGFRESLRTVVQDSDPEGWDPIVREMVVVGHSQGGLLAKLAVVDPGDALWRSVTSRALDEFELTEAQRAGVARNFFFEPVPYVRRVVFVATPHRGSYRASAFARRLAARFMRLPGELAELIQGLGDDREHVQFPPGVRNRVPTSLDSMAPNNPLLLALADLTPVPGVKAHSIIAVRGTGDPESASDGVVSFQSARVDFAESELVIRSGHSVQGTPEAIEEVRRILLEQVAQVFGPEGTRAAPPAAEK